MEPTLLPTPPVTPGPREGGEGGRVDVCMCEWALGGWVGIARFPSYSFPFKKDSMGHEDAWKGGAEWGF